MELNFKVENDCCKLDYLGIRFWGGVIKECSWNQSLLKGGDRNESG